MTRQEITEKVIGIVAEVTKTDAKGIGLTTTFKELGADSLDMLELQMKIEDAFQMTIPDDANVELTTVNQVVDAIEKFS